MSDIFREVDEALQQEKLLKIWHEYKSTIVASIAILLVSTAATTFYRSWDASRDAEETARLTQALESKNPQTALMEVVKDTRKGHQALALMSAANLDLQAGNKTEATELYKKVIDEKSAPRNIRDLARILYIQNSGTDDISVLTPILSNEKSPWIWHARVEAAVASAHKDNNYTKALDYLKPFKNAKFIPATLKERAMALASVYEIKAQSTTPVMPAETMEQE